MNWTDYLAEDIEELDRWFEGRFVTALDPDQEHVPATRFLEDEEYLRQAIARAGSTHMDQTRDLLYKDDEDDGVDADVRVAVSRFVRHYAGSLSAIALVGLANGVGLDLSPRQCTSIIWQDIAFRTLLDADDATIVRCTERPTRWDVNGPVVDTVDELRAYVWERLYAGHFVPFIEAVRGVTRVSYNLLWTNVAEWVGMVSDAAEEYLGPERAEPFVADRVALLSAETLPGMTAANPLLGRLEWVPTGSDEYPTAVQTRAFCCMTYLLPDRLGRLCGNCGFLPLEDRVALMHERHGVSMSTPGGAATKRAIELGQSKLGTRA